MTELEEAVKLYEEALFSDAKSFMDALNKLERAQRDLDTEYNHRRNILDHAHRHIYRHWTHWKHLYETLPDAQADTPKDQTKRVRAAIAREKAAIAKHKQTTDLIKTARRIVRAKKGAR